MLFDRATLPWLPEAPKSFRQICKASLLQDEPIGQLRHLSGFALGDLELTQLGLTLRRFRGESEEIIGLAPINLAIVSNGTTDHLALPLEATGLRFGLNVSVTGTPFGKTVAPLLDRDSILPKTSPQFVLLAIDARGFGLHNQPGESASAEDVLSGAIKQLETLLSSVRQFGACPILQTLAVPGRRLLGNAEPMVSGTPAHVIAAVNDWITRSASVDENTLLFDIAGLANMVGGDSWFNPIEWNLAKLPFSSRMVPLWCDHLCRLLAAIIGRSRKCLVLDLDNTLWGGAIGDDSVEGIVIGPGSALGEAFIDIQMTALELHKRGVVLAVCSKNDAETAMSAFRSHPEMVLRSDHIACFVANWNDKCTNLSTISARLNLGLDSFVLLDDNPAERAHVRSMLPMIAVPELPADPAQYADVLLSAGYFEAVTLTHEDAHRGEQYAANKIREAIRSSSTTEYDYLLGLKMELTLSPFQPIDRIRIHQLFNKTNQFNLLTHRYAETEVVEMESDPACFTLTARLNDRFGNNGLISIVTCRCKADEWEINNWVMSCRVLGRQVERALFYAVVEAARLAKARFLVGRYVPTKKNIPVRDHYGNFGFDLVSTTIEGITTWRFPLERVQHALLPMAIRLHPQLQALSAIIPDIGE